MYNLLCVIICLIFLCYLVYKDSSHQQEKCKQKIVSDLKNEKFESTNIISEAEKNYQSQIAKYNVNIEKAYLGPFPGPFEQPIQGLPFNADYKPLPFFSSFQLQK